VLNLVILPVILNKIGGVGWGVVPGVFVLALWLGGMGYSGWRVGSVRNISYREFVAVAVWWLLFLWIIRTFIPHNPWERLLGLAVGSLWTWFWLEVRVQPGEIVGFLLVVAPFFLGGLI